MTEQRQPWHGSNSTDAMALDELCGQCQRDARYRETDDGADSCPIVLRAYCCEPTPELYHTGDWLPHCTEFIPEALSGERVVVVPQGQMALDGTRLDAPEIRVYPKEAK